MAELLGRWPLIARRSGSKGREVDLEYLVYPVLYVYNLKIYVNPTAYYYLRKATNYQVNILKDYSLVSKPFSVLFQPFLSFVSR